MNSEWLAKTYETSNWKWHNHPVIANSHPVLLLSIMGYGPTLRNAYWCEENPVNSDGSPCVKTYGWPIRSLCLHQPDGIWLSWHSCYLSLSLMWQGKAEGLPIKYMLSQTNFSARNIILTSEYILITWVHWIHLQNYDIRSWGGGTILEATLSQMHSCSGIVLTQLVDHSKPWLGEDTKRPH